MKKIVLIDGNNLLFRSYYATAYSGNMMRNSKGFPTNALYGFASMLNKILNEEKPEYILVALDTGKTFRHDNFEAYKAGRAETPDELKIQFDVAKRLMDSMGIKWLETIGYEADDIIGTFSTNASKTKEYETLIISSDRDLLQLINESVSVKLLKTKDYLLMNNNNFVKEYGIEPEKVIDLKGLQGDPSDNIPGVKGIGEKTALKLLQEYKSVENIYVNIDNITGKVKEKLLESKDAAFMSKQLATIYKEVPVGISIEDIKYIGTNNEQIKSLYEELEFYSLLKTIENKKKDNSNYKIINNIDELNIEGDVSIYLELDNTNYHTSNILGMGIYNENISAFIPLEILKQNPSFLTKNIKYTYDAKKVIVALKYLGINISNITFDTLIAANLLNYNVNDDIAYIANSLGYEMPFYEVISKAKVLDVFKVQDLCVKKAKFIFDTYKKFNDEIIKEGYTDLFNNLEMPLIEVLSDMEYTGIKIDKKILEDMREEINIKLELLSKDIFNYAGAEFNINSYKQLGEILFDKLNIPSNKKRSTDKEYLVKYIDKYPIISKILEYKMLTKINSTYAQGLQSYILKDNKIHTIYTQTLTRTGRLSSIEPNLQNIPMRYEYGKLIRKAFIPDNDMFMSIDYSQIELRIFAHFSMSPNLVDAFNKGLDIHTKTAMDLFKVSKEEVNSDMRRKAKAVNFGILYGISSFGLSENLDLNVAESKAFIDKYLETFPGIKNYMDSVIKEAHKNGYVKTLMGRRRNIEDINNKNYMIRSAAERIALNTPIQGSSADIIKKAMVEIYAKLKEEKLKSKLLLQVHDELVFDVIKEEKQRLEKIVVDIMENCCILSVPVRVDTSYGANWYETK